MRPHRNPFPLPLLNHFGVGLLDQGADSSQRLAPPVAQLLDPRIDQPRGRVSSFPFLRAALLLHGCCPTSVAWGIASQPLVPSHPHSVRVFDAGSAYHVESRLDLGTMDPVQAM